MTRIRERFGLVGEMSLMSFITILFFIFGAIGGAYAFSYSTNNELENKLGSHITTQSKNDQEIAEKLGSIDASLKILLKDKALK